MQSDYTYVFNQNAGGQNISVTVCVSPSVVIDDRQTWLDFIEDWVEWLIPHFDTAVSVATCAVANLDLSFAFAARASIPRTVVI